MRKLCDQVESQVRCLNALGHDAKSYGLMLIPIFMNRLPEDMKIIISRKLGTDVWDIQQILDIFKTELQAREKVQFSGSKSAKNSHEMSGSCLVSSTHRPHKVNDKNNNRKCVFCNSSGHKPKFCNVVTKPDARNAFTNRSFKQRLHSPLEMFYMFAQASCVNLL